MPAILPVFPYPGDVLEPFRVVEWNYLYVLRDYEAECVEHWSCMREEERHRVRLVRRDDLRLRSVVVFVNVPAHGHPCGG